MPHPNDPPNLSAWQRHRVLLLAVVLLVAGAAALPLDLFLAQFLAEGACPGELRNLFETGEPFGDGMGVLLIVILIWVLAPHQRWATPRIFACSWGAGMAANVIKMSILRWRPYAVLENGIPSDVWATFGGWFPLLSAGSRGQSFPSAHSATAAGLAMVLVWLYPRGRWLFPLFVALVAGHRVQSLAHFLSDVFCGAALGIVVAWACLRFGPVARWFERRERQWGAPDESGS